MVPDENCPSAELGNLPYDRWAWLHSPMAAWSRRGGTTQFDNDGSRSGPSTRSLARGDLQTILGFVHPDLEWTYLDPTLEATEPQVCHGRVALEHGLEHWTEHRFKAELEEIEGNASRHSGGVRRAGVDGRVVSLDEGPNSGRWSSDHSSHRRRQTPAMMLLHLR
jgi:hypothetical protein